MARELSRVQSGNGDEQEQDGDIEGEIEGVPNVPSSQRERERERESGEAAAIAVGARISGE